MRRIGLLCLLFLLLLPTPVAAAALAPKNKGLFLTPVREYIAVNAGQSTARAFTIANITEVPARVVLSVEQFAVEDFTYDYMFKPSKKDWVKLSSTEVQLQPNKSQQVSYTVNVPKGAAPGGYYFTIFATETLGTRKVRVGEALYVTVNGELRLTSHIQKATISSVSFGGDIHYEFDAKSTGNVHFMTYVSGRLKGFIVDITGEEKVHILLPGTVRTLSGTIPPPLFPGIYHVAFGYRVDDGQQITSTAYIAYFPQWFLVLLAGFVLLGATLWYRRRRLLIHKNVTDF
ncbi:MAG TPA: hypothetical protein VFZ58_00510 [Candidatus Saccharimonadales bacterium]